MECFGNWDAADRERPGEENSSIFQNTNLPNHLRHRCQDWIQNLLNLSVKFKNRPVSYIKFYYAAQSILHDSFLGTPLLRKIQIPGISSHNDFYYGIFRDFPQSVFGIPEMYSSGVATNLKVIMSNYRPLGMYYRSFHKILNITHERPLNITHEGQSLSARNDNRIEDKLNE